MRLLILISLVFLVSCRGEESISSCVDRLVFESMGGTVISDPDQLTMKEIHLDNGALVGREIVVEGAVVEIGKFDTFLVLSDETARMLIVMTELSSRSEHFADNPPRIVRVLGTVENGKRGLPFIMAKALKVLEKPEGA